MAYLTQAVEYTTEIVRLSHEPHIVWFEKYTLVQIFLGHLKGTSYGIPVSILHTGHIRFPIRSLLSSSMAQYSHMSKRVTAVTKEEYIMYSSDRDLTAEQCMTMEWHDRG